MIHACWELPAKLSEFRWPIRDELVMLTPRFLRIVLSSFRFDFLRRHHGGALLFGG